MIAMLGIAGAQRQSPARQGQPRITSDQTAGNPRAAVQQSAPVVQQPLETGDGVVQVRVR